MKWKGVLGNLCTHLGQTGPEEHPEDGEMNEMTLPSRQKTRTSSRGVLSPSTLPLVHWGSPQYWIFTRERGSNISFLENLKAIVGFEQRQAYNVHNAILFQWFGQFWNSNK